MPCSPLLLLHALRRPYAAFCQRPVLFLVLLHFLTSLAGSGGFSSFEQALFLLLYSRCRHDVRVFVLSYVLINKS